MQKFSYSTEKLDSLEALAVTARERAAVWLQGSGIAAPVQVSPESAEGVPK